MWLLSHASGLPDKVKAWCGANREISGRHWGVTYLCFCAAAAPAPGSPAFCFLACGSYQKFERYRAAQCEHGVSRWQSRNQMVHLLASGHSAPATPSIDHHDYDVKMRSMVEL